MRLFAILIWMLALGSASSAIERVALVIGNAGYQHVPALDNPTNDARAVTAKLEELGFVVFTGVDLSADQQRDLVVRFASELEGSKVALFYYSGHGMQVAGRNFIIPVDADPRVPADFDFKILDVARVLAYMQQSGRVTLAFLDACRDNPFESFMSEGARSLSTSIGLAAPELEGTGLFIGFATSPGRVADDGTGDHSPFTAAILRHLGTPGLEINQVMNRVKADVRAATNDAQRPWANSDLNSDFYLVSAPSGANTTERENALWQIIRGSSDPSMFQNYLVQFPNTVYRAEAEARIVELSRPPEVKVATALPAVPVFSGAGGYVSFCAYSSRFTPRDVDGRDLGLGLRWLYSFSLADVATVSVAIAEGIRNPVTAYWTRQRDWITKQFPNKTDTETVGILRWSTISYFVKGLRQSSAQRLYYMNALGRSVVILITAPERFDLDAITADMVLFRKSFFLGEDSQEKVVLFSEPSCL